MTSTARNATGDDGQCDEWELEPVESFAAFYRRELPELIAFARVLSGSSCADDIAQEAMLAAYRRWDAISVLDVPSAWVRRVCARRAVSTLRRRVVESQVLLGLGSRRVDPQPLVGEHEAFWAGVRKLPRRQAQVIALHSIYVLDEVGVAATLRSTEGKVKVHMSRARAALALQLDPSDPTPADAAMTIDDLARAAAADARGTAAVDPDLMLEWLNRSRPVHTIVSTLAAVGVCLALLLVGVGVVTDQQTDRTVRAPTGASSPTPNAGASARAGASPSPRSSARDLCADPAITCLGGSRFRMALPVPVTFSPSHHIRDIAQASPMTLEAYRNDIDTTGVSVLEHARPVKNDASWSRDPAAGRSASSMATWLSNRPFLVGATVRVTTIGGRKAWRVSAKLKPTAGLRAEKGGQGAVAPAFTSSDNVTTAYNASLVGDYTLLDVPGAGVAVIWSWTLGHSRAQLAGNRAFVKGLYFG